MAHQTRLTHWLVQHRDAFELKIREFDWPSRMGLRAFDFEVSIQKGGLSTTGRGTDSIEELALEKACAEAIERCVCQAQGISTVGVAAHTNEVCADSNAKLEMIERSLLNWHLATGAAFSPLQADDEIRCDLGAIEQAILRRKPNASISFGKMASPKSHWGVVCLITCGDGQTFVGFSFEENRSGALWKSFFEAARNFAAFADDPDRFLEQVRVDPQLWNCRPEYSQTIQSLFQPSGRELSTAPTLMALHSKRLSLAGLEEFLDCPAIVAQAWVVEAAK